MNATATPCDPFGTTSLLTDAQVSAWLGKHHPALARDLARETRRQADLASCEFPMCGLPCLRHGGYCDAEDFNVGTPVSDLIAPETHWAFCLWPGCGAYEIGEMAAGVLPPCEAQAFRRVFAEGVPVQETAQILGVNHWTVRHRMRRARLLLFAAVKAGMLPQPEEDSSDRLALWASVMAAAPAYRKPSGRGRRWGKKAYVCDCGRHLSRLNHPTQVCHLDHRRVDPSVTRDDRHTIKERILKCPCGRNYPESQWRSLAS